MTRIIADQTEFDSNTAETAPGELWLDAADAERATGFVLKPEGFCRGEVCVPVPPGREAEFRREAASGRSLNVARLWQHLGHPVVHDVAQDIWVLGTASAVRSAQLQSLEAPDFALPDLDGTMHRLSEQRGRRVMLVSWASW